VRVLRAELDVEPVPETVALYRRSQQTSTRKPSTTAAHSNLPLASFIGRVQEIAKLKALLLGDQTSEQHAANRLVTVTGLGGCGKTRLVLQVARDLLDADSKLNTWRLCPNWQRHAVSG
jgi:Cdc6-like AAA superfamily ATPase